MMRYNPAYIGFLLFSVVMVSSCKKKNNNPTTTADTVTTATYTSFISDNTTFNTGVQTGTITDADIPEASGLAVSRKYPAMFWTHNDSNNPNDIFLVDSTGKKKATVVVNNATNRDWEDIAIGPGPTAGINYIYLGEIGDNNAVHSVSYIYRFPEPDVNLNGTSTISDVEKISFAYPDGPRNAETLLLDPLTKDLYVISKETSAHVYVAYYPQRTDTTITLKELDILPLSTLTAGDISATGSEILLKNYEQIYYWKRTDGQTIGQTLLRTPSLIPYITEPKGEAMGWAPDGSYFYTTGERKNNVNPGVYKYVRR